MRSEPLWHQTNYFDLLWPKSFCLETITKFVGKPSSSSWPPKVRRLASGLPDNSLPTDMRKYNGKQPTEKCASIDGFLAYAYWHIVPCTMVDIMFYFSLNNHIFIQIYIYAALNILKLLFLASVLHSGLVFMEAEPLAETEPLEEVDGAALCASGLFLPGSLDETIDVFFLLCLSCSHSLLWILWCQSCPTVCVEWFTYMIAPSLSLIAAQVLATLICQPHSLDRKHSTVPMLWPKLTQWRLWRWWLVVPRNVPMLNGIKGIEKGLIRAPKIHRYVLFKKRPQVCNLGTCSTWA